MRNRLITSLIGTALLATTVVAQQPQRPQHGPVGRCIEVVGLSDTQKEQVRTILEASAPRVRTLHEQLKTDRQALRELLQSSSPEACAVGNAVLKVEADQKAIAAELEKIRGEVEAVLTPEQKLKFAGCMDALRPHRDGPGH